MTKNLQTSLLVFFILVFCLTMKRQFLVLVIRKDKNKLFIRKQMMDQLFASHTETSSSDEFCYQVKWSLKLICAISDILKFQNDW